MKISLTKPQLKVSSSKARFRILISGRRFVDDVFTLTFIEVKNAPDP